MYIQAYEIQFGECVRHRVKLNLAVCLGIKLCE